jgi:hypothetical protein
MKTFYVSLAADLLGVYIEYQATSETAVRQYLEAHYLRNDTWKLPWCGVYDALPAQSAILPQHVVKAQCGQIWEDDYTTGGRA